MISLNGIILHGLAKFREDINFANVIMHSRQQKERYYA